MTDFSPLMHWAVPSAENSFAGSHQRRNSRSGRVRFSFSQIYQFSWSKPRCRSFSNKHAGSYIRRRRR